MNYAKTVLQYMTHYPGMYSTEFIIQKSIFITVGNGLDWFEGELVNLFPDELGPIERTKESVLSSYTSDKFPKVVDILLNAGGGLMYSGWGTLSDKFGWLYPYSSSSSRLDAVYKKQVEPTQSWRYGIFEFSERICNISDNEYKEYLKLLDWKYKSPDEEVENLKVIRDICFELKERYFEDWMYYSKLQYELEKKLYGKNL